MPNQLDAHSANPTWQSTRDGHPSARRTPASQILCTASHSLGGGPAARSRIGGSTTADIGMLMSVAEMTAYWPTFVVGTVIVGRGRVWLASAQQVSLEHAEQANASPQTEAITTNTTTANAIDAIWATLRMGDKIPVGRRCGQFPGRIH